MRRRANKRLKLTVTPLADASVAPAAQENVRPTDLNPPLTSCILLAYTELRERV
jgi:hypothetical protein